MMVHRPWARLLPNMRLKLTAPFSRGRIVFVTTVRVRRSLGAVR